MLCVEQFYVITTAEMAPDVYDGDKCDQVKPRWFVCTEGDQSGSHEDDITFKSSDYPAGTKITVEIPQCPKCQQDAEMCKDDKNCSFDWNEWTENKYS